MRQVGFHSIDELGYPLEVRHGTRATTRGRNSVVDTRVRAGNQALACVGASIRLTFEESGDPTASTTRPEVRRAMLAHQHGKQNRLASIAPAPPQPVQMRLRTQAQYRRLRRSRHAARSGRGPQQHHRRRACTCRARDAPRRAVEPARCFSLQASQQVPPSRGQRQRRQYGSVLKSSLRRVADQRLVEGRLTIGGLEFDHLGGREFWRRR